jgi:plasmid replication initiation protein
VAKATKPVQALRVTKSNTLISASYRLTLNEQRLILAAISRLDPRRPMPKRIRVSASDYSEIYGVALRHSYTQLKSASDDLYERDIDFRDATGRERRRWVDRAKYLDGEGVVELSFTIHVIPYLSMLYSKVTSYDLRRVARVESANTLRLFELMMQFRKTGWLYIELDSLRLALGLSDAYPRFNNFRQYVIDPAVAELKEKCSLEATYELISEGRKVVAIRFEFNDLAQLPLALELDDLPEPEDVGTYNNKEVEAEWFITQPIGEIIDNLVDLGGLT